MVRERPRAVLKALKLMQHNRPIWLDASIAMLTRHGFTFKQDVLEEKRKLVRDTWKPKGWNRKHW